MPQVLDYSAGFPGAANIKAAGYVGAVRYIGFPDRSKCTTRAELADFTREGIGMALVFEQTAGNWRGGIGQGRVDGRRARNHANAIGFPASRPIYMAVDQDVVQAGEFNVMASYLQGAGEELGGKALTGVYGEADVIDKARQAGVASWFWQTAAWSHGRRTTAHLFQHVGTVYVGPPRQGIACDFNDVLAPDWGQHNYPGDDVNDAQDAALGEAWKTLTQFEDPGPNGEFGRRFIRAVAKEIFNTEFTREGLFPREGQPTTMTLKGVVQYFANNTDTVRDTVGLINYKLEALTPGNITPEQLAELKQLATDAALAEASRRLAGE